MKIIRPHGKEKIQGFTLVEQLIVLSLIVVLVGFGSIRMTQTNQQNEIEHATRNAEAVMRFLQMKALQEGKVYRLGVDENKKRLNLKRQSANQSGFEPAKSSLLKSFRLGRSLSIEIERGSEILFYPDGSTSKNRLTLLNNNGARVFFRLKNRIGSVEVNRA